MYFLGKLTLKHSFVSSVCKHDTTVAWYIYMHTMAFCSSIVLCLCVFWLTLFLIISTVVDLKVYL